jgi:hypothetical protein
MWFISHILRELVFFLIPIDYITRLIAWHIKAQFSYPDLIILLFAFEKGGRYFQMSNFNMRRDQVTMSYFNNFDNESLKKYKNKKYFKKIIDMFFYL